MLTIIWLVMIGVILILFWRILRDRERGRRLVTPSRPDLSSRPTDTDESRFSFAEFVPVPLIVLDRAGRSVVTNHRAVAMFGDALGAVLRHPALQAAVSAARSGNPVSTQLEVDVPVQRVLQIRLNRWGETETRKARRREDFMIVVLDDYTEAATSQRKQADFVAYASHELRTPLASISAILETIEGQAADDPAAQKEFLAIMSRQAARMGRLIDRLLHLSRAQRLAHWRPETELHLDRLWPRMKEEIAGLSRQYAGQVMMPEAVSAAIFPGDADQLVQMLLNLVENAVKHAGPHCQIEVSVRREATSGIIFSVSDDGPGVAAQHLPRLTEQFYRVASENIGGSGLGLAIVKQIVDRHAGRLKISSAAGEGFRCEVWLPGAVTNHDAETTPPMDHA
ncbi:hypothetical protein CGLAMM_08890 [Acetobacteraceae bacterium EV16G]|uniref:histidine kinase n=1 Tax=Sorlinia euscelidii TaxID=3081148 RepID=A0ABU7U0Y1_9PROT